ncbi:NAD(P)/FAD-dependent oxidoreductase [Silanimonas sp.]|jgi:D-amino-acid dehydrogenase|uniref:NAD(P)/FAD-dependent oxidoreductase n=1 Tax=Silanimonas sp. TaxID=1929290 RepID=UPI0037C4F1CC
MTIGEAAARRDVLVVGGGVIGLACAQALSAAGRSVLLLERDRIGAATSHGNCGTLTPSHALPLAAPGMVAKALGWMLKPDAPFLVRPRFDPALWAWLLRFAARCDERTFRAAIAPKAALLSASQALLDALIPSRDLDCGHRRDGLLYVWRDGAAFEAGRRGHAVLREHGITVDEWDGARTEREEPALREGVAGGLFFPDDGHLRPDRYTTELARIAAQDGAVIEEGADIVELVRDGDAWKATARDGRSWRARELLLASGPWAAHMAGTLGLRLPIIPGKGYSITYERPTLAPRRPLVLKDHSVCVTAWDDGYRLGSTMEFAGYDERLTRARLDALERGAAAVLREPTGPMKREEWFGWRPMTWDDLPILGAVPGQPGLWLAVGHGMMGMGMSAVTGRLLADLVTGRPPVIDPTPYAITRFG